VAGYRFVVGNFHLDTAFDFDVVTDTVLNFVTVVLYEVLFDLNNLLQRIDLFDQNN
jgi:hypothetical protein